MAKKISSDFPRKSDAVHFGEAMESLLKNYHIESKYYQTQLISSWELLVGKAIAKRTSKIFIKEKKLFVVLTSAPLKNELVLSKNKILEIIKEKFKVEVIEDIVFL